MNFAMAFKKKVVTYWYIFFNQFFILYFLQ